MGRKPENTEQRRAKQNRSALDQIRTTDDGIQTKDLVESPTKLKHLGQTMHIQNGSNVQLPEIKTPNGH